jgi:hypothetical protein
MEAHIAAKHSDPHGRPVAPYHGWREGTDQTLCGLKPLTGWCLSQDLVFPPEQGETCPVCLSHVNASARPDHIRGGR